MLQRTDEWLRSRAGRFTASEIHRLLANGRRDMTEEEMKAYKEREPKGRRKTIDCIGDGLYSYALENAIEEVFGFDPEDKFISFDMRRGIDLEPIAYLYFQRRMQKQFIDVVEVGFVKYGRDAGASSDGRCSDGTNVEIKCPKRAKFFKIVVNGISELDPNWIDQVQHQMLCTNTKQTRFWLYHEQDGKEYGHEIIIERDEERIAFIEERLKIAVKAKEDYMTQILKNQQ